jgi:pyruvate dehydrogenase E1 component alpha subunit
MKKSTVTKQEAAKYLKQMWQIRLFEDKIMDLLARNIAEGGSHLYAGEEAVAVGACAAINPDDYIVSTHRGHGHCVAKGGKLDELLAEILGKVTGCCRGKGGSLHLADVSTGNLGANGIVGGGLGIATGAGLTVKMKKTGQVVICFLGDGAVNQGLFHECLNMASFWKLPVIYVCENNLYAMSVSVKRSHASQDLTKRALAYDMPSEKCDGQDVLAVKELVSKYVDHAREGKGPSFLVCETYRYYGHSRSDPRVYRTKEEEKFWAGRDPITLFAKKCVEQKFLSQDECDKIEAEVREEIEHAEKFAIASADPDPSELYKDLYSEA